MRKNEEGRWACLLVSEMCKQMTLKFTRKCLGYDHKTVWSWSAGEHLPRTIAQRDIMRCALSELTVPEISRLWEIAYSSDVAFSCYLRRET